METLGLIMMIIGGLLFGGGFAYLFFKMRKIVKAQALEAFNLKKEFSILAIIGIGVAVGALLFFSGIPLYWKTPNQPYEWVLIVFGSLLSGYSIAGLISTFYLHFYQTKFAKSIHNWLFYVLLMSIPILICGIWILSEGFAQHMTYPLINGISWKNGLHFTSLGESPNIAWYAICILAGAIIVYFVCDHYMYKVYGKHGLLESTFLIAFPSGIIGARIGYVIGQWNVEFGPVFNEDPFKMFRIHEGGLTILSGAIVGIIVGVLWFRFRHKDIPIGPTINIIVPTILIAQAVGRWGNFFNNEVHGELVCDASWRWLPTMILENMRFSSIGAKAGAGMIYAPLFFVEFLSNLAGYFILTFGFGKGLKKYVKGYDLAFGYVAWYGMTRVILEPLRYGAFNMGENGAWSWIWSIIFVGVGLLAIVINHIVRWIINERKNPQELSMEKAKRYFDTSLASLIGMGTIIIGIFILGLCLYVQFDMPTNVSSIALVPHNVGLILWIISLCLIPSLIIPCLYMFKGVKKFKMKRD